MATLIGNSENLFNIGEGQEIGGKIAEALSNVFDVAFATVGDKTYAYLAAENAIQILEFDPSNGLSIIGEVRDDRFKELLGVRELEVVTLGGDVYLLALGSFDDGITTFRVQDDGNLDVASHLRDMDFRDVSNIALQDASDIEIIVTDDTALAIVASPGDDAVNVLNIENDGSLRVAQVLTDGNDPSFLLDGAVDITSWEIGGTTYVGVVSLQDDGVSVFALDEDESELINTDNIANGTDGPTLMTGPTSVTSATVSGATYIYVAGFIDESIIIFEAQVDGTLDFVAEEFLFERDVFEVPEVIETFSIEGIDFLRLSTSIADTSIIYGLNADGTIRELELIGDDALLEIDGTFESDFVEIGGRHYYGVVGYFDDGASFFEIGGGDNLIQGTDENDTILGLAGNDELFGGFGSDLLIGGEGSDTLSGQGGSDYARGGNGEDRVFGRGGDDRLFGDANSDLIKGGAGDDRLKGGGGADELIGGGGDNIYTGDGGNDDFVFAGNSGTQTVTDFTQGADDLDVSAFASSRAEFNEIILIGDTILQLIADPTVTIVLEGFDAGLTNGDFIF